MSLTQARLSSQVESHSTAYTTAAVEAHAGELEGREV
jgi:hypothetical protein